jgi:L-lactate dehydrogenase complex protein LldG
MTQRETILARIREVLKNPAPPPEQDGEMRASARAWLPPVGETIEEQIELFRQNARNLKAEFHTFPDFPAAVNHVRSLSAAGGWKKIALHAGSLTDPMARELGLPEVRTDSGYAVDDLESCDAALTECEVLVAQTGSVLVSSPSAGGRALSVLPPHHVVLARRGQMVSDLTAALQHVSNKFGGKFPSFMSFITGPSRTGDIERILVLGAHGPKKLSILLVP